MLYIYVVVKVTGYNSNNCDDPSTTSSAYFPGYVNGTCDTYTGTFVDCINGTIYQNSVTKTCDVNLPDNKLVATIGQCLDSSTSGVKIRYNCVDVPTYVKISYYDQTNNVCSGIPASSSYLPLGECENPTSDQFLKGIVNGTHYFIKYFTEKTCTTPNSNPPVTNGKAFGIENCESTINNSSRVVYHVLHTTSVNSSGNNINNNIGVLYGGLVGMIVVVMQQFLF
jgi:hypothetical protein